LSALPRQRARVRHLFLLGSPVQSPRLAKRLSGNAVFRLATRTAACFSVPRKEWPLSVRHVFQPPESRAFAESVQVDRLAKSQTIASYRYRRSVPLGFKIRYLCPSFTRSFRRAVGSRRSSCRLYGAMKPNPSIERTSSN
jgi:hypothetical protein